MVVEAQAAQAFNIDTGLGTISPNSIIMQPINYNQKVRGVLALAYTSKPRKRDLKYIENLAYQFGITIVAARRYEALQELTQEAVEKSITDSLTGLKNRGFIQVELERLILVSHRYNNDLALIMIDIDHFKHINDTFGHQVGDDALKSLAKTLRKQTRASDLVVRYGGEEFIVLLPQSSLYEVRKTSEKLRKAVESKKVPSLKNANMTISLGVAILTRDDTSDTFINRADKALYQAKEDGRNLVRMEKAS